MRRDISGGWVVLLLASCALAAGAMTGCNKSDLSTPKGAASTLAKALQTGDVDTARKASTGADDKTIQTLVSVVSGMKKLQDAMTAKFGAEETKSMTGRASNGMSDMLKKLDDADEKVSGDTAVVTPKGGGRPINLKKIDGNWKVDLSELSKASASPMFESIGKAASETADEVNAGKYKSAAEARKAMTMKMMGGMLGGNPLFKNGKPESTKGE